MGEPSTASQAIKVAIIGGGLGGTVLMNALMSCPNIDAHIYEANSTFKERGASVGLATNAQRALGLIGLSQVLKSAGAVNVDGGVCIMGVGPDEGKTVIEVELKLATVHRAALLRELMGSIPQDRMHVNKKLISIEDGEIKFEDGTSIHPDVIIGSDGIHSSVRRYILGEGHPAVDPVYAGIWDCRAVVPFEEAQAKIGSHIITKENFRQTIYSGDGVLVFRDIIDDGKSICIVGAGLALPEWDNKQWTHSIPRGWMIEQFKDWPGYAKAMVDLLYGDQDEIPAFMEWESGDAPVLFNNTICMMGDAAHATTPWQGSGLGQAIEDALILKTALSQCDSVKDIEAAFKVYDQLMRPRGQRVVESSRRMGKMLLGTDGLDAEKLGRIMKPMWDFIHHWHTEGAMDEVVDFIQNSKR